LDLDSDLRTIWPLTGTTPGAVSGLNFDAQGRVWIPDLTRSDLYRFDPQSDEFCHYQLPHNSASFYIINHDGSLWLADRKLPYIYRINPNDDSYEQWLYRKASDPLGMTFDANGDLWWSGLFGLDLVPSLVRLSPNTIFVTFYELPDGKGDPVMVDALYDLIWYSDSEGRFGRLDPSKATGETVTASRATGQLSLVQCYQNWQPLSSANTQKSTASAGWTAGVYTTTTIADGWAVYQLPEDSLSWGPWGIRARQDGIWVVDQERQKLVHIPWQKSFIPLVTN
jgi:streptogramin lyase